MLIQTLGLSKIYGTGETAVHALHDVNLAVEQGEFFAIMGPSGCGKSTLLNMLGALDQPTSGEVWVAGQNLAKIKNVDEFRASTVGFVFQLHNLLPTLTAQENVEVPMQGRPIGRASAKSVPATYWIWWAWRRGPSTCRTSFPVGSASASPLPAPWRTGRS